MALNDDAEIEVDFDAMQELNDDEEDRAATLADRQYEAAKFRD